MTRSYIKVFVNQANKPLYALFNEKIRVSFEETDKKNEFYAEHNNLGIFRRSNNTYWCQNLSDNTSYEPDKTLSIVII